MGPLLRLLINPLGGVGGPQPSDSCSEPSDLCGGLGYLALQGFPSPSGRGAELPGPFIQHSGKHVQIERFGDMLVHTNGFSRLNREV